MAGITSIKPHFADMASPSMDFELAGSAARVASRTIQREPAPGTTYELDR